MIDRTGYATGLTPEQIIRIKDIKARKGHLCQGGDLHDDGPVCGCGEFLNDLPDLFPGRPAAPAPAPDNGDPTEPPWDSTMDDTTVLVDHLEERGRAAMEKAGAPDMRPSVPPIKATQPYGPGEVERAILDQTERLERGSQHEAALTAAAEQLKVAYELAYARAIRDSTARSADQRKADAIIACEKERLALMDVCAARDAMKSITHTLRATLSGLQSVGRSIGVAYQGPQGRGR